MSDLEDTLFLNESHQSESLRTKWQHVLLQSLAGILTALLLWFSGLLTGIEGKTYDLRASLLAKPSPVTENIILVVVDQASIDWVTKNVGGIAGGWPWPRELFAAIITNCLRRGAKSVGFDVLFTEDSTFGVDDDIKLKNAMSQAKSFALGSVFPSKVFGSHNKWPDTIPRPQFNFTLKKEASAFFPVFPNATFPVPELISDTIILSNVQHEADSDGIFRRVSPFVIFDNVPLPALGLGIYLSVHPDAELTLQPGSFTLDEKFVPLDNTGKVLLNYRGPRGTYKHLSAATLIRNEFQLINNEISQEDIESDLAGKHIFFGYTAPGLKEIRPSPTDGAFSGVEINATIFDNMLAHDFIRPVSSLQTIFMIVILTMLATFIVTNISRLGYQICAGCFMIILPLGLAFLFYWAGHDFKMVPVLISVMVGTAYSIGQRYFAVGQKEKFISHSFKHYLSPVVIDQLVRNPDRLKLGGQRKELTFFFSDLEGFTKMSELMEAEDLTLLLNEYLTAMTDIILDEQGTVDKYEGDAIIAFWNAPLEIENHAERAVRAALRCQKKLEELYPYFLEQYGIRLRMRIGIHTGHAVVGNIGSSSRFDYSVIGDAVNLSARLEGANKFFGTSIMISSTTFEQLGGNFHCRELGRIRVVGRNEPVTVYEPLSYRGKESLDPQFDLGLQLFYQGDFEEAYKSFSSIDNSDSAARAYRKKCENMLAKKGNDWDGVWDLGSK